jgi:hypothetical protein
MSLRLPEPGPPVTTDMHAENRPLAAENAELRRVDEVLRAASACFGSGDRPDPEVVMSFIDACACLSVRWATSGLATSVGRIAGLTLGVRRRTVRCHNVAARGSGEPGRDG